MADPAFSSLPPAPSGEGGMPGFAEEGEEEHNLEMQMHLASIGGAGEGAGGAEEYFDYYDDVGPTGGEEEQQGGPFSNNNNNCSSSNDEEEEEEDVIPRGIGDVMTSATQQIVSTEYSHLLWEDEAVMIQDQMTLDPKTGRIVKRKKGKRQPKKTTVLSNQDSLKLGEANFNYTQGNYKEALSTLHEVIRASPNAHEPWLSLAMIQEELGDQQKSFGAFLMAAHLSPKDAQLWKRLGQTSMKFNHVDQAIYCLNRAARADPTDIDVLWDCASLNYQQANFQKAIDGFTAILNLAPFNVHVVKELCKIYVQLNEIEAAVLLFEGIMDADRTIPLPKDLDEERENRRKRKQAKKKSKGKAVATGDMDADEEEEENGDDFDDEFEDDADEFFNVGDLEDGDDDDELVIGQTGPTAANRFRMGFQELHMLAELYMELREFAKCIHAIKEGVRRLHGRSCCEDDDAVTAAASSSSVIGLQSNSITGIMDDFQPMFTGAKFDADLTDLDREFDDQDLLEASPGNAVPLDIRVQMGICRLHLDQITVAQSHFDKLLEMDPISYAESFFAVAEAFLAKRHYQKALEVLSYLTSDDRTNTPIIWNRAAKCHHMLGNLDFAVELYLSVIEVNPHDIDSKLELAKVYEALEDDEKANALIEEINTESKNSRRSKRRRLKKGTSRSGDADFDPGAAVVAADGMTDGSEYGDDDEDDEDEYEDDGGPRAAFITRGRRREDLIVSKASETARRKENITNRDKLKNLFEAMRTDRVARASLENGGGKELDNSIPKFQGFLPSKILKNNDVKTFFNSERSKKFTGFKESVKAITGETSGDCFQGLDFEEWYTVFVQLAMALSFSDREDEAHEVLKSAFDANIFYHNEERRNRIRLHMLASATYCCNYVRVSEICRWFLTNKPWELSAMKLYNTIFQSNDKAISVYAATYNQKYFLRQLRIKQKANEECLDLLMLYGHVMLIGRSYILAIYYYSRAYSLAPQEPLLNLCLGLSYIHRAMQRKSENRHMNLMHGFAFVFKYVDIEKNSMEATYNLARSFHQIGLNHLAVPLYEKSLSATVDDPRKDIRPMAAYNLSLIYVANGNAELAAHTLKKHCTI